MFREYLLLLLLGHTIGDFYTQTQEMTEKKDKSIKCMFIHGLSYWGTMLIVSFPFMSLEIFFINTLISVLHFIIDIGKYAYLKKTANRHKKTLQTEKNLFAANQILHICCMTIVSYAMVIENITLQECAVVAKFFDIIEISEATAASWVLAFLLIHKPTNIIIQKILVIYKPVQKEEAIKKDNNAGRFIGTIERIIMLLLISIGQYAAIGLVLTAKSIARYDRIAKEKDFAEYYLLGTLMSTVIVILIANILVV